MRRFFSRYVLAAVLVLLFLFCVGAFLVRSALKMSFFFPAYYIFTAVCAFLIVNGEERPEYKLSGLALSVIFPFVGAVFYGLICRRGMRSDERDLLEKIENERGKLYRSDTAVFFRFARAYPNAIGMVFSLTDGAQRAVIYNNSACSYYGEGEKMYLKMLSDLEKAKRYIFLEYYIISEGEMWQTVYEILKRKAAEGVKIRILYDDVGCMKTLPKEISARTKTNGIEYAVFSPVTPLLSVIHNNRDHRKIMLVDGNIAYTGGINIGDEYINKKSPFGKWKDSGVRIKGDGAVGFLGIFLSMWAYARGECESFCAFAPERAESVSDGGYYIPFSTGPKPVYKINTGRALLLNIINQSRDYLYITTPYLVTDHELTHAFINAAKRGVDVRIITPGIADKKIVNIMTKSFYPPLVNEGVKIYEYTPGFIHSKCVVCDDLFAIVGSINVDYRSLMHNFEDAVLMCASRAVMAVKDDILRVAAESHRISDGDKLLNPAKKLIRLAAGIISPIL